MPSTSACSRRAGRAARETSQANEIVGIEHQVLRACFGGDTDPTLFRLPDESQRAGGGDVTDVNVASGLRRQQERRVHGNGLDQGWSRFRVGQRVLAPGGLQAIEPITQELMVLGVESVGQIETRGLAHRPQQLRVIDGGEEGRRRGHERLERGRAFPGHPIEIAHGLARRANHSAPEGHVDDGVLLDKPLLLAQQFPGDRCRMGLGHLDD